MSVMNRPGRMNRLGRIMNRQMNRQYLALLIISIILFIASAFSVSALIQTDIVYTMDDTYVNSSAATINYDESALWIDGSVAEIWFRFDLSDPSGYYVTQALLYTYILSSNASATVNIQQGDTATWTETDLTWNTKPGYGSSLDSNTISAEGWQQWDLISTYSSAFSSADSYISYTITGTNKIQVEDKENSGTTDKVPYLNLTMMIPEVYLISPSDDQSTYDTTHIFQYNTTDTGNIVNCSLVLDSAINMTNSTAPPENMSSTFNPSALFPGDHTWTVRCYDSGRTLYQIEPEARDITILARVDWYNPSSSTDLDIGNAVLGGSDASGTRQIYSNNTNNDAVVSCSSGDCGVITTNWSTTSMTSGQKLTAGFNCSTEVAGSYSANFALTSSQDASADTLTVDCAVLAPDIRINSTNITFSDNTPTENQEIDIIAGIYNDGNYDATSIVVRFYDGNYTTGTQIGTDWSVDISAGAMTSVTQNWTTSIGTHDITVVVDPPIISNGSIWESDETNNYAHKELDIPMWTYFVGNVTGTLALQTEHNETILKWNVTDTTNSLIYVTDTDSNPDFASLRAFGRNIDGVYMSDDFTELDAAIGTTGYPDSVNITYTSAGNPKSTESFTVFGIEVTDVPSADSTDSTPFTTGILWDSSDDEGNNQFDNTTKEDIVFITRANQTQVGMYGTYDYEIRVPARLKNLKGPDTQTVTFYAEIK